MINPLYLKDIKMKWFGGIEAGGTKFNCIIAQDPDHILAECTIPTETPQVTIAEVIRFFKESETKHGIHLEAIGVACFGPVNLDQNDPLYGSITSTPKMQWQNTPLLAQLKSAYDLPFGFDTDVNGAALGEGKWGAGQGLSDFLYVTIGTGIGGGVICNGLPVHGLIHPELGHLLMKHDLDIDPYPGHCPFHGDCLEGLASGPAITERWGISTHDMPTDHPAWDLEAHYIGQAVHNWVVSFSPQRIILGGGVMKKTGLLEKIRLVARDSLNGYIDSAAIKNVNESYIVTPHLGDRAGSMGAVTLASIAASSR
jgi:fructokinase